MNYSIDYKFHDFKLYHFFSFFEISIYTDYYTISRSQANKHAREAKEGENYVINSQFKKHEM